MATRPTGLSPLRTTPATPAVPRGTSGVSTVPAIPATPRERTTTPNPTIPRAPTPVQGYPLPAYSAPQTTAPGMVYGGRPDLPAMVNQAYGRPNLPVMPNIPAPPAPWQERPIPPGFSEQMARILAMFQQRGWAAPTQPITTMGGFTDYVRQRPRGGPYGG